MSRLRKDGQIHIGLNLVFLVPRETGGMEVAAREVMPELVVNASSRVRFTAFVNREAAAERGAPWGEVMPAVTVPVQARNRVQWVLGEQSLLPLLGARSGVALMHSLASTAPLWGPFRRVVTVHDLIYARFPEAHSGIRDKGMRLLVPVGVKRSDRVIADSQSTRQDLLEIVGASGDRVEVVPLGLGAPRGAQALSAAETRERFALGESSVLLSLSAKRPHKNLIALLGALAELPVERRPVLVLPGYATSHEAELRDRAKTLAVEANVRFPEWVSPEELEGLWALARAFVYPSLYEGFGLPVLEAMIRGVPVACSSSSSLPEVVGEAALLFDPGDEHAMSVAIRRLLDDDQLVSRLVELGRERAATFTWRRTARLTLAVYARALGVEPRELLREDSGDE